MRFLTIVVLGGLIWCPPAAQKKISLADELMPPGWKPPPNDRPEPGMVEESGPDVMQRIIATKLYSTAEKAAESGSWENVPKMAHTAMLEFQDLKARDDDESVRFSDTTMATRAADLEAKAACHNQPAKADDARCIVDQVFPDRSSD